ncbi:tyrosine-type recombinase/integrase [Metasolibacillus meyeri]|uniref:Tyrosine-type recombinase/integrase n=1 Tax=Metasolibacillus meyeri TaxID=1071052 RepID=A0AAW9NNT3_9BACL|nr:tyrosine-type recombinase/integrase [Metasolibacillus meyeri]MEC1177665.1 tyrosine-type recombinase/integrase [Metasolibacillus meyeri]
MASITKRGSTWQYSINRYVDGARKPIVKGGFRTKAEATAAAMEIELQLKKGQQVIVKEKAFSEYFSEWVELYKSNKHKTTYQRYKNTVERVKEYFKDMPIQKITRADYQKFINWYGEGKSRETVKKLNTHIRACIRDAMEDGYIHLDFTRKAELTASKTAKKSSEKHLNYMDSVKLYNELFKRLEHSTDTYHLLLLGLVSGLRYGELVGLTPNCFDFKKNEINVYQAWDYKEGSGFADLKNTHSERTISIDKKVMNEFKKLILALPENPYNLIFYRPSSVKVITNEGANKVLRGLLADLEINTITAHGLRHTHASVLLYKGANIHSVSKRLGHADIQTTLNHYSHVLKEMEQRDELIAVNVYVQ